MHALQHANAPVLLNACTASHRRILPCKKCTHYSMQMHLSCKMHASQPANTSSLAKCMHYSMQRHLSCKMHALHHANTTSLAKCMHCIMQTHPPLQNARNASRKHLFPCTKCIITACKCTCPAKCMHCITQTHPPLQNACTASCKLILPCKKCTHHSMQMHLSC